MDTNIITNELTDKIYPERKPGDLFMGEYTLLVSMEEDYRGRLWRANKKLQATPVSLRFLPDCLCTAREQMKKLRAAVRPVFPIQHKNLVRTFEMAGNVDNGFCLVSECAEGNKLSDVLKNPKNIPLNISLSKALYILFPIAEALDYLHDNSIVHGSLCPENIYMKKKERDLSIQLANAATDNALRNAMSDVLKTAPNIEYLLPYRSPEEWRGKEQTPKTDLYSFATIVWLFFTGGLPFSGHGMALRKKVLNDTPFPPASIAPLVSDLLLQGLCKDPNARFPNCVTFIKKLDEATGLHLFTSPPDNEESISHNETETGTFVPENDVKTESGVVSVPVGGPTINNYGNLDPLPLVDTIITREIPKPDKKSRSVLYLLLSTLCVLLSVLIFILLKNQKTNYAKINNVSDVIKITSNSVKRPSFKETIINKKTEPNPLTNNVLEIEKKNEVSSPNTSKETGTKKDSNTEELDLGFPFSESELTKPGTSSETNEPVNDEYEEKFPGHIGSPPPAFLRSFTEMENILKDKKDFVVIAGQILYDGKAPAKNFDVKIFHNKRLMSYTINRYGNGWFISQSFQLPSQRPILDICVVTDTQRPKWVIRTDTIQGKVGFQIISLEAPSEKEFVTYTGVILNEEEKPLSNVNVEVCLSIRPLDQNYSILTQVIRSIVSDEFGRYQIKQIFPQLYMFRFRCKGYNYSTLFGSKYDSEAKIKLHWNRELLIDYELSETPNFNGNNTVKNVSWDSNNSNMKFDKTSMYPEVRFLMGSDARLWLSPFYSNRNLLYDAGEVPFDSIKRVDSEWFDSRKRILPCQRNHVYVVQTFEGKYVKIIIRDIRILKDTGPETLPDDNSSKFTVKESASSLDSQKATPPAQSDNKSELPVFENRMNMRFRLIPKGSFQMGNSISAKELLKKYPSEPQALMWYQFAEPKHKVVITKPFYLAEKEVTYQEFEEFVKKTKYITSAERRKKSHNWTVHHEDKTVPGCNWYRPGIPQSLQSPVVHVSRYDAEQYVRWLNSLKMNMKPKNSDGRMNYTLPTEAQWEYACRAGTTTCFFWGDEPVDGKRYLNAADKKCNVRYMNEELPDRFPYVDGFSETAPVGSFSPNPWGLYDMLGNVMEWCRDTGISDYYTYSSLSDPYANGNGIMDGVMRGGGWRDYPGMSRSGFRFIRPGEYSSDDLGFRVAIVYE